MNKLLKLFISIVICEAAGLVVLPLTIKAIPGWYAGLNKPFFSPPNWIFGPVWSTLYLLMGISVYLIWSKGLTTQKQRMALIFFSIQLFFNFLWSILFFGLKSPTLALIDIVLLWLAILITMIKFEKSSKFAAYLFLPYFFWVSFALILNFSIVRLN